MLPLIADENVKRQLLVGLIRRLRHLDLDLTTVQGEGLVGRDDPTVLAWAAKENRVLLTHDVGTMPFYAYQRLTAGESMPGVIVVPDLMSIGRAIDEVAYLTEVATFDDVNLRVIHLPL